MIITQDKAMKNHRYPPHHREAAATGRRPPVALKRDLKPSRMIPRHLFPAVPPREVPPQEVPPPQARLYHHPVLRRIHRTRLLTTVAHMMKVKPSMKMMYPLYKEILRVDWKRVSPVRPFMSVPVRLM